MDYSKFSINHKIIGYGSLLSHKSLKETIKDRKFKLVIVKGYKRVFNLLDEEGKDILNVQKDKKYFFNGVLFSVNESELKEIKEREDDYDLEETEVYDFFTKKNIDKGILSIDKIVAIENFELLCFLQSSS